MEAPPGTSAFYTTMVFQHESTGCAIGGGLCDDATQVLNVISYMQAHYTIDTTRIFAAGGSKGGSMTEDTLCDPRLNATFAGLSAQSAVFPTATGNVPTAANVACPAVNGFTSFLADGWLIQPASGTASAPIPTM